VHLPPNALSLNVGFAAMLSHFPRESERALPFKLH
jgi:hypothetical protein